MKKIPIIALLIVGCAGNLASKEEIIINIFYTIRLNNIVIIDILIISSGFVLRILGGGALVGISFSVRSIYNPVAKANNYLLKPLHLDFLPLI